MPGNGAVQCSQSQDSLTEHFVSKTLRNTARFQDGVKKLLLETREKAEILHRGAEILPRKRDALSDRGRLRAGQPARMASPPVPRSGEAAVWGGRKRA